MLTLATQGTLAMRNRFVLRLPSTASGHTESATLSLNVSSHTLTFEDCQLHYWLSGPQEAPVVVLTHGEGADHHSFDQQIELLSQTYRVLCWDLRGHGKSESIHPFSVAQAVADLHAILRHERISSAFFVGVAAGGLVTQLLASQQPDVVSGLVLMSCLPLGSTRTVAERIFGRLNAGVLRILPYWFVLAQFPARLSVRPEVQLYTAEAMRRSGQLNFSVARAAHWGEIAGSFECSTPGKILVALGAYDRVVRRERATALWQQMCPDAPPVLVPGAGHAITQDNPAFTGQMILDFLNRTVRRQRIAGAPKHEAAY